MATKSLVEIFGNDDVYSFFKQVIEGKAQMNEEQRDVAMRLTAGAATRCLKAIKRPANSSPEFMLVLATLAAGVTEPEASDAEIAAALIKITTTAIHFEEISANEN